MTDDQFPIFLPYLPGGSCYVLPKQAPEPLTKPVPPKERWIIDKQGNTSEEYLASGKRDLEDMRRVLNEAGVSIESLGNILDFGCGDGRMIRWLEELAYDREVWGTDINAERILWCKQNLSPRLRFATTTIVPHLPFEDRHFGFGYAGSVFTHIDDLADAWFAELRRILRPGGKLFITVHLKADVELLDGKYKDSGLTSLLRGYPEYEQFAYSDFNMFTIGRSSRSIVFYDIDYLRNSLEPMFRLLSVTEELRLYQNGLLLERQ